MTALLDDLRLEVLTAFSANRIANHSAQDGSLSGWSPADNATLTAVSGRTWGYNGRAVRATSGFRTGVLGPRFSVVAGHYVNYALTFVRTANGAGYGWNLHFFNLAGERLRPDGTLADELVDGDDATEGYHRQFSPSNPTLNQPTTITLDSLYTGTGNSFTSTAGVQAPPGAAFARPYFIAASSFAGEFYKLMVLTSPVKAAVVGPVFNDTPDTWTNFLGGSISAAINRGGDVEGVTDNLDAGTATIVLTDPAFAPEVNDHIRPGRTVRLTTAAGVHVFRGTINDANTVYEPDALRVTINAADAFSDLANAPAPHGSTGTFAQRIARAMLAVPLEYDVYDTATPTSVAGAIISTEESGTARYQADLARDTTGGLYYVSKANRPTFHAANSLPSAAPVREFSDDPDDTTAIKYTVAGSAVGFDTTSLVNTLMVQRVGLDEEQGGKAYGPYANQESVIEWGTQSATLTVNEGEPDDHATTKLAAYANPTITVTGLSFDATDLAAVAASLELYQAVRVKFGRAGIDAVYRIIGISHTITARRWTVDLRLKPLATTSTVAISVPSLGANTGPADVVPFPRLARRSRSSTVNTTTGNTLVVLWNQQLDAEGIPYDPATGRFTIPRAGRYLLAASLTFPPNANGVRVVDIRRNGGTVSRGRLPGWTGTDNAVATVQPFRLNQGDTIDVTALQNSGSTLAIQANSSTTFVAITYLGP